MYIPKQYEMTDYQNIVSFMQENNFVTIVTIEGSKPVATHLPVIVEETDEGLYISGHFAKNNKQWQTIEDTASTLIIFHGPHAYVSASWYEDEDVSTWDYQSVHVYGQGKLLTEAQLETELVKMLDQYEGHRDNGVTWNKLSDQNKKQIKGIVGFKVKANHIEAKAKLSQNRSDKEKENIILQLNQSGNWMEQKVAKEIDDIR